MKQTRIPFLLFSPRFKRCRAAFRYHIQPRVFIRGKRNGFFFFPVSTATELVSAGHCSEMDAVLDLWLNTVYNDPHVLGSDVGPVVYPHGTAIYLQNYLSTMFQMLKLMPN